MRVARAAAQAKVNLFLRVGPRDESGFHSIFTVFTRLDLADEVVVRVGGDKRSLDVSGPAIPKEGIGPAEKNLAFRAAVEYAKAAGWPSGFEIALTKNIPVGAGLGGGSADAGAVLRALDALAPRPLGSEALMAIAARLGSDVPFMASEFVSALGRGRGEQLNELKPAEPWPVLVAKPAFAVATADAYRWLDESRPDPAKGPALPKLIPLTGLSSWANLSTLSVAANDFEPPVEARHPELATVREAFTNAGAIWVRLAGSGSCVYGVFADHAPSPSELSFDGAIIATRASSKVVPVVVQE